MYNGIIKYHLNRISQRCLRAGGAARVLLVLERAWNVAGAARGVAEVSQCRSGRRWGLAGAALSVAGRGWGLILCTGIAF